MAVYLTGRRLLPPILAVEFSSHNFLILIALAFETLIWYVNLLCFSLDHGGMLDLEWFGSMVYAGGMKKIWS